MKWPLERAIGVRIFLRSGAVIRFTCKSFQSETQSDTTGHSWISGYGWNAAVGGPLFLDPSQIEAIQTQPLWRRRPTSPPDAESEA